MKIVFLLNVKLVKKDTLYYTTGAVDRAYLERHKINKDDELIVVCREENALDQVKSKKLALASGNNIDFITLKNYKQLNNKEKQNEIKAQIQNCDLCYVKLPGIVGLKFIPFINKNNKTCITEVVGCTWDSLNNYGKLKYKMFAPISYILNKKAIKNSKSVIYVTDKFLQKRYPTNGNNIACSDVNISEVSENVLKNRIIKIEKNDNEKIKLGLIGSLNVNFKGHKEAIKAVSILKDKYNIELHFLGVGNSDRWKPLIKKYKVEKNVFFDGTLPSGEAVFKWMDDLDLFLMPSLQEGLPRSLVEAMSRACPAIGTNTGGIPELINKKMICRRKDYKELAKKIEELINNKEEMKEIAYENFNTSKKFIKAKLDKKRKEFENQVIQEGKNDININLRRKK